ncbi:GNAT family N-acetyltransferase [Streptomyces sp. NPDC002680]|uniref:GNAT family N-acetyltransferase n=1 Tax=Streptomyces sp. NPDC002680 TaxID=3364659 RepID=UPI0036AE319A
MPRVERVGDENWAALKAVRLRALEADPEAFGATLAEERARDEAFWRRRILVGDWFLARAAEEAVGVAALVTPPAPSGDERQLDAMWVVPAWRGRGVGEALIYAAVEHAARGGATSVSLTVVDGNTAARGLYRRMGFQPTGERSPRPRDPGRMHERFRLTLGTQFSTPAPSSPSSSTPTTIR